MTIDDDPRFPHLGKLSIAILEHIVKPVIGDDAVNELKAPFLAKERHTLLIKALENAEKRFIQEFEDSEICQAILALPLANLPALQEAITIFYAKPADKNLAQMLQRQLSVILPHLSRDRTEKALSSYLRILRQELVSVSPEISNKLNTLAMLAIEHEIGNIAESVHELKDILRTKVQSQFQHGSAPPTPSLVIGREDAIRDLKTRLGISRAVQATSPIQVITAIRGWPGVGKSTVAAALAHDPEVGAAFPDGVLWISLGPSPDLHSALAKCGRALGTNEILHVPSVDEASTRLAELLRNKRVFMIIDDVWQAEDAIPFKVGGRGCAMVITTRLNSVAQVLAPTPNNIYRLEVLSIERAMELFQLLAPDVVSRYPNPCRELISELEGLPLAIQVAGRLLNVEFNYGFGVIELLDELRQGVRLLEAQVPADRPDGVEHEIPTVTVLLQKSVERLDDQTRSCFAILGAFAPKPATFDLKAMQYVWEIDSPEAIARQLVDRGLIEFVPNLGRYQMHALLVMYAKSIITE